MKQIFSMASASSSTAEQPLCRIFSLADIQSATGGFSEDHVIGKGGFGKVYKALIDDGSTTVAVKRLSSNSNQGEREFAMEMETLTKVRHRNLVSLIGYCREEGEMILIYEYMANGTLADHLYKLLGNLEPPSWDRRLRICIGAGRGLDYLHSGCSIIHRDVKSTNILLDESFRAKVSDFGLAKHLGMEESESYVSASVKGSFGYFDPSYFSTGRLTRASDTYAFGVVLLEALSGRSAVDRWMADEGYLCMRMWAQEKIQNGKAEQIIAPVLRGEISDSSLKTFVGVAKRCLHHEPKKRITMTQAVAQLELALEQQEKRGTPTNRLPFWPFRSRAIASGSTQKDELEAIHVTAIEENKQSSVDAHPLEAILVTAIENRRRGGALRVDHTVDEVPIYVPAFPLAELEDITHYFSLKYLIAEGPGGELIFRIALKSGQYVAIKQLSRKLVEPHGSFIEQVSEVSRLRHENVVPLLGYCLDGRMRALLYEFAPRGSLHSILHEPEPAGPALSWHQRIKIAAGVAQGLCYVHDNAMTHRHIRSTNVLLFDDEIVKITHPHPWNSCVCKASLLGDEQPNISRRLSPRPTIHEPECPWATRSPRDDVYSFGLVLLELLTGAKLFDGPGTLQQELVSWAKVRLFQKKVHEIVDPKLKPDYPIKPVEKMAEITKLCLYYDSYSRPDMTTVFQALQIALQETHEYYLQTKHDFEIYIKIITPTKHLLFIHDSILAYPILYPATILSQKPNRPKIHYNFLLEVCSERGELEPATFSFITATSSHVHFRLYQCDEGGLRVRINV